MICKTRVNMLIADDIAREKAKTEKMLAQELKNDKSNKKRLS